MPSGVANAVAELNARLGIPKGLSAMGLKQEVVEAIADGALGDHCHLSTPRQPTKAQYVQLIEESWGMKVKDKVCVVTGAAGGIGEAIARRYAKEGAKGVVVADMDGGRLEKVAKDIGGIAVAGDVGKEAEVKRLIAEAGEQLRAGRHLLLQRRHRPRRPRGRHRTRTGPTAGRSM